MKNIRQLKSKELENKTVFLRVDWNCPLDNGKISDNNRIKATLPTIKYLLDNEAKIVIGTHLGRPEGKVVKSLSTKILALELSKLIKNKIIVSDFVTEPEVKDQIEEMKSGQILVLGNLRWHKEEEANNKSFAKILAGYTNIFVNDGFAVAHRDDASIVAICEFLPSYAGLLLEREVESLRVLFDSPRHPFVLVLGGAKVKDKIGIIKKFVDDADKILIGGAMATTFRFFDGVDVSESLCEKNLGDVVAEIKKLSGKKLILPTDEIKKDLSGGKFSILDIGPKTIESYKKTIAGAKTIFWNGNMGKSEEADFATGTSEVACAIAKNPYVNIAAGGDTAGFINTNKLASGFTFISTGGGAALEFLAGVHLPGLVALGYYQI
ncbi:MAG: phosphoglycerate kinase [Candidatus Berkelbacteria bacterium]|nr:phosphoglycerate kinase [Candidatus Berkelbacteria bacterium]